MFYVYIDGFNLYKGSLEHNPQFKWLDLRKLSQLLTGETDVRQIKYFTARLKTRFEGDKSNERQNTYLRVLRASGIDIIYGEFRKRRIWSPIVSPVLNEFTYPTLSNPLGLTRRTVMRMWEEAHPQVPKSHTYRFQEKGSDVNLASHLLRDVFSGNTKQVLVISGDSDLFTPLRFVSDAGADVRIAIPGYQPNILQKFRKLFPQAELISKEVLSSSQFENPFKTENNHLISKPKEWL